MIIELSAIVNLEVAARASLATVAATLQDHLDMATRLLQAGNMEQFMEKFHLR